MIERRIATRGRSHTFGADDATDQTGQLAPARLCGSELARDAGLHRSGKRPGIAATIAATIAARQTHRGYRHER
jgi:hypothetical protein